ncbi:MAG: inositol monophosphatase [bacterium]
MKNEQEIEKRRKIAVKAARQAGKILCENLGSKLKVKSKGDRNLVSNVDLKAENIIIGFITEYFPQDDILSEETPFRPTGALFRWVIDPLDGTHNYIKAMEVFGTSIALAMGDEVVMGVIYMPVMKELYEAQKGKGAYKNSKKIKVSNKKLSESVMIFDSSIRINKKPMLGSLGRLADEVFNIRMFGSTARSLTYVAEGKAEMEIEYNDSVWDFAAGLLIVEEAGGRATDFNGHKWNLNTRNYVASNGVVHKEVLERLRFGR